MFYSLFLLLEPGLLKYVLHYFIDVLLDNFWDKTNNIFSFEAF